VARNPEDKGSFEPDAICDYRSISNLIENMNEQKNDHNIFFAAEKKLDKVPCVAASTATVSLN
jgi:hypothetical protein